MLQIFGAECSKPRNEGRSLILRQDKYWDNGPKVLCWGAKSVERDENVGNDLWKKTEGKNKGPWMGLWFIMREKANLEMLP